MNKFLSSILFLSLSLPTMALQCGDSLNTDTVMTEDLDCSSYSGYAALTLRGEMVLRGNGFRIISPNTQIGVYSEFGSKVKVKNLEVQTNSSAVGVVGYNVEKLVVRNVTVSGARIGVDFYAEDGFDCERLKVVDSTLTFNDYGIKVYSPNCEYSPNIKNTDLSNSKAYALNLKAKKVNLSGLKDNNFDNSENGIMLSASEIARVRDLDLSESGIPGTQVFVYDTAKVKVKDSKFGNSYEGVHIYDAQEVIIRNIEVVNSYVGLKVATERVSTQFSGRKISSEGNESAGVLLTSFSENKFSLIDLEESKNSILDGAAILNQN
jgi:nitrous oxidase accessory protein NosD